MTAPVRIEACAWGDLRFATLARLCGFADAEHALIKVSKIWSWQTEHYTPDAPTYVVDAEIIESALGEHGAERMVRARLAEATPDGFRIKGSEDRIEWLFKSRRASAAGGEATRRKHANKGRPGGLSAATPNATPEAEPQTGLTPGALAPDLSPDRSSETHIRVRERHPDAGRIARRVWDHGAKVRGELTALKLQVQPWSVMPDAAHPGWIALLDRICELLVERGADEAERIARNRIDVAIAKAKADGDAQWFAPLAMFTRNSFETWAHLTVEQVIRKAPKKRERVAGDLIGAADPRSDHGVGLYEFSSFTSKAEQ